MKQPHSRTQVWTPDMDPRQKANAAAVSPPPPAKEEPKVVRVQIPAAELPATRLKTPATTAAPVEKKELSPKAQRRQRRQEVVQFAADNGISEAYALLVIRGAWSLELAKKRQAYEEIREERSRLKKAGDGRDREILQGWIEQKTDLVRMTPEGLVPGHLLELDKYQWLWDDQPELQPKIQTYAVLSQEDHQRWSPQWVTREGLAERNLRIPDLYSERRRISLWKLNKAAMEKPACLVQFYNGVEVEGFILNLSEFALDFAQSLEEGAPRMFIWRHAIYSFWIFVEPEPVEDTLVTTSNLGEMLTRLQANT